jgi:tRNA A-37 threonylcarbamoyl transferase component Bud32
VLHPNATLTKLCGTCGYRYEATVQKCPADGSRLGRVRPDVAVLGAYRLVERLGTGGMGAVYRAIHEKLGRTVAIKVLNRSLLADRTNIARFFQEARSVNTIRHPNVVDIYDFVTAGKDIYTVMEFLVGQDLHHALYAEGGRPFAAERAVLILEQICCALQAAHDRSIIHRDLKPANVFLTRRENDEFVKLLDFGLAKLDRTEGRMTREGVVLGTPEYMAPEQARGAVMDGRADLYGVGCLAYHMLTGCQLFAGGSYADVMVRHVKEAPPPPRTLNPRLSEALERAVMRCLAKDPDERPASALGLAEELCAAVGRTLSPATHASTSRARAVVGESIPSAGFSAVISRSLRLEQPGRKKLLAGATAAAAVVLAVALWARPQAEPAPVAAVRATAQPAVQRLVQVRLQSMPSGATVSENGVRLGVTPYDLSAPPGSEHVIDFALAGHQSARQSFRAEVDTTLAAVLEPAEPAPRADQATSPDRTRRRVARRPAPSGTAPGGDRDLDSRARTINPFAR